MKKQNKVNEQQEKIANKKIYQYLKSINELIEFQPTREFGFNILQQTDTDNLNIGLTLYYYYIKGKNYSLIYRANKDNLLALETAHDYYSDLFYCAKKNDIQIKNMKYLFVLAHTKFLLSLHINSKQKKKLIEQARNLSYRALKIDDTNSSFIWLSLQLNA